MNFEQHDKQVRDAALRRAFPVEEETPDRFRQLLEQLSARQRPSDGSQENRKG